MSEQQAEPGRDEPDVADEAGGQPAEDVTSPQTGQAGSKDQAEGEG